MFHFLFVCLFVCLILQFTKAGNLQKNLRDQWHSNMKLNGPFDRKWVFRVKMEKYDLLTNYFEVMFLLSLYDVFTQQALTILKLEII